VSTNDSVRAVGRKVHRNHAQTLLVMTARPGTESYEKFQLLSVIGHQSTS
jgi:hypothetical protein